ncbi:hypothetical protein HAX54_037486, partial [Datura stramonium]|nr:hypothetical protein [Datura stramonium]
QPVSYAPRVRGVDRGHNWTKGKVRRAATPDYAYPHQRIFALDSQWVTEPPAGNTS